MHIYILETWEILLYLCFMFSWLLRGLSLGKQQCRHFGDLLYRHLREAAISLAWRFDFLTHWQLVCRNEYEGCRMCRTYQESARTWQDLEQSEIGILDGKIEFQIWSRHRISIELKKFVYIQDRAYSWLTVIWRHLNNDIYPRVAQLKN